MKMKVRSEGLSNGFNITSIFQKKTDKLAVSVPLEKDLYGVKIRKLPNGAYKRRFRLFRISRLY